MVKYDANSEDGMISEWNEAVFKMKRLHELQTEINRVKMDLLSRHLLMKKWNYEVWFSCVDALYSEGESKYSEEEKKEIIRLKKIVEHLLIEESPYKTINQANYGGGSRKNHKFIKENWKKLKYFIELMESKVKYYNDKHGLSTKNQENMDGRSILR